MADTGNSMIERIARVLCTQNGQDPDRSVMPGGFQQTVSSSMRKPGTGPYAWESYTGRAYAILAAMREPTETMRQAAGEAAGEMYHGAEASIYSAMIAAALEDGQ